MIARLQRGHAFAHLHHHARPFMAQHGREEAFGVVTRQGEGIGMAHPGVRDAHQHLTLCEAAPRQFQQPEGVDQQQSHGGTGFHVGTPEFSDAATLTQIQINRARV